MSELLKKRENIELLNNLNWRWAMYSEVYSPKDELEIFQELFEYAISGNKKIHIIWITLKEELDILEKYYVESGYLREDVNCFIVNWSKTLVSVSVNIENLIWKWSDYKANWKNIFFVPPIREAGQNKAMFKGINRWSIAGIYIWSNNDEKTIFLQECIKKEQILPMTLGKCLRYNLEEIGFGGELRGLEVEY
jgi:dihydroorotase-like cyclic amidohydrolase